MTRTLILAGLLLAAPSAAQDFPQYPEGTAIPRSLTAAERALLDSGSYQPPLALVTAAPEGPVHCAAEYEPMESICIAWEGASGWKTILARMTAQITTVGDADVYCAVDSAAEATSANSLIAAEGANMSRVHFPVVTTDSIWMRDYGPRYIFQGDVRAIVDHTYNRPRPWDNQFPGFFAGHRGQPLFEHPLSHGGGNFHLDALGDGYLTRLINNENPGYTENQIHGIFEDYQNLDCTFFTPLPTSVDATQHIDMWMQVFADDEVMISDWPAQSGSNQDNICDAAAVTMANLGFTVHRIPARTLSGTHYTYTNVVMCNDLVLIPSYSNGTISQYNSQALAAWQAALPGKTIVQIPAQSIVTAAGVLHCIVMHVPEHRGGLNPTAYLVAPNAGTFNQGENVTIEWVSDDDVDVSWVDLQLSLDGGATWPTTIASNRPRHGSYSWTVPAVQSTEARIRAVARDAQGRGGNDMSDNDLVIVASDQAAAIAYGTGKAGTLGVPSLSASGDPELGASISLDLADGLPNGTAIYIRGTSTASTPFDGGTILVNYNKTYAKPIDALGDASFSGTVPNKVGLVGVSLYWQVWIQNDPVATGQGWSCSNGLETLLGY